MNIKDTTRKLARWSIYLQGYDFDIIHKKGSTHLNVDILSRPNITSAESLFLLHPIKKIVVPSETERAHLLGHFKKEATFHRLQQEFTWPNMMKHIEKLIKKCQPFSRHTNVIEMKPLSQSLDVIHMFDRVGIDCIFGVPETRRIKKNYCIH